MLVVKREFPHHRWEPVYIGTQREPLYSELLTWEGQQDKMAQVGSLLDPVSVHFEVVTFVDEIATKPVNQCLRALR